jgi:hypothetical protein
MAGQAARAGIAVQIHGIGDAAVRLDLDVLSALPRVGAAHHRVEHAQLVDPTDIPRFGTAGIVASVQPCHLIGDAPAARAAWGDRTAGAFPLRSLIDAGALLAFGTDGRASRRRSPGRRETGRPTDRRSTQSRRSVAGKRSAPRRGDRRPRWGSPTRVTLDRVPGQT